MSSSKFPTAARRGLLSLFPRSHRVATHIHAASRAFSSEGEPRHLFHLSPEERARKIDLLVCDMAGTTVHEGGLVYATLQKVMNDAGLGVSDQEMLKWHGAQKTEVVGHFVQDRLNVLRGEDDGGADKPPPTNQLLDSSAGSDDTGSYYSLRPWSSEYGNNNPAKATSQGVERLGSGVAWYLAQQIDKQFEVEIQEAYFSENSSVTLIHAELLDTFARLRASGCKVALNTGYPTKIQQGLLHKLGLKDHVDAAVCSGDVGLGRPYPYMTQLAMQRCGVMDARRVAKAGDTSRDIEEGLNAGCSLTIGVLSGAGSEEGLRKAGADLVLKNIVEFGNLRCGAK